MTLGQFREATKDMNDDVDLILDANGNPVWYLVEKPRQNDKILCLMDKSGMDLGAEIDAASEHFGITDKLFAYLKKNGVTLDEIKSVANDLYDKALDFYSK